MRDQRTFKLTPVTLQIVSHPRSIDMKRSLSCKTAFIITASVKIYRTRTALRNFPLCIAGRIGISIVDIIERHIRTVKDYQVRHWMNTSRFVDVQRTGIDIEFIEGVTRSKWQGAITCLMQFRRNRRTLTFHSSSLIEGHSSRSLYSSTIFLQRHEMSGLQCLTASERTAIQIYLVFNTA